MDQVLSGLVDEAPEPPAEWTLLWEQLKTLDSTQFEQLRQERLSARDIAAAVAQYGHTEPRLGIHTGGLG